MRYFTICDTVIPIIIYVTWNLELRNMDYVMDAKTRSYVVFSNFSTVNYSNMKAKMHMYLVHIKILRVYSIIWVFSLLFRNYCGEVYVNRPCSVQIVYRYYIFRFDKITYFVPVQFSRLQFSVGPSFVLWNLHSVPVIHVQHSKEHHGKQSSSTFHPIFSCPYL